MYDEEHTNRWSHARMVMDLHITKVWKLVNRFKTVCQQRGYNTSKHEDWIQTGDGEYHNFRWIQTVHPSTFEKICLKNKIAIRLAFSYQVIDVSYIAWLFLQTVPEIIFHQIDNTPQCSKKNAIYDLTKTFTRKPIASKFNETDSQIFKEFEEFLQKSTIEVKSIDRGYVIST